MSYIWEKEVKSIEWTLVTFVDETSQVFTERQLEYLVKDEEYDLTTERNLLLENIIPEIMEVLREHNVKKVDIQAILNWVVWEYNETFNIAVGKAFGTYEEWKHTAYFPENIRFSDIDRLL